MKYISVCSGIEAATVAWHPLGWEPLCFSEFDKFPSKVLAHHYPNVTNQGDMTKFMEWPNYEPDVLVGGTPCQSFSVAGLRKGLADERGNLMLTYIEIAARFRPRWLVWENVPGCLSTNGGRDFGSLLGGLAELGYGFAYRILDAQYFGVAQRRRRVFVVAHLGSWQRAAAVLFERHSLSGHPAPSREAGKGVTTNARTGFASGSDPNVMSTLCATDGDKWGCNQWVNEGKAVISYAIQGNMIGRSNTAGPQGSGVNQELSFTLNVADQHAVCFEPRSHDGHARVIGNISPKLNTMGGGQREPCVAVYDKVQITSKTNRSAVEFDKPAPTMLKSSELHAIAFGAQNSPSQGDSVDVISPTLDKSKTPGVLANMQVRRLTPIECERLQGFPDGYTAILGDKTPDSPRYKALGNSMAVPVMRWIGERINLVNNIKE